MHTRKQYSTRDLALAAFLIEQGHHLVRIDPDGRLKLFIFDSEAESDVLGYYNGGRVSARSFHDTIRSLKGQCNPR